jgi:hypothetical protein
MPVTEPQIRERLDELQSLVKQIGVLRSEVGQVQAEMAAVQEEYEREVGPANAEAARLRGEKVGLNALLTDRPPPAPPPRPADGEIEPPPPVVTRKPDEAAAPPAVQEDPRFVRKRELCLYLLDLLQDSQERVLQAINAMQTDSHLDVGDMLEALPWGPVWEARWGIETPDGQYMRLGGWKAALSDRVAYWQRTVADLNAQADGGIVREKRERTPEAWLAYLRDRAGEQEKENERLRHEVAVLEQQWRDKQGRAGGHV